MDKIDELINRRENQLLLHACLYYQWNVNIISDDLYDQWSFELANLIKKYPDKFKKSYYYNQFKGFIPDSGYYLPYKLKTTRAYHIYQAYKKEHNIKQVV